MTRPALAYILRARLACRSLRLVSRGQLGKHGQRFIGQRHSSEGLRLCSCVCVCVSFMNLLSRRQPRYEDQMNSYLACGILGNIIYNI